MIRRPPRSTLSSSSAASDVYKRQEYGTVSSMAHDAGEYGNEELSYFDMDTDQLVRPSDLLIGDHAGHNFKHIHSDFTPLQRRVMNLSLIHISEPTRLLSISYAVFCLKKKKKGHSATIERRRTK
eukprot:TRINITY_DN12802_c0_g1_i2.p2 TRINITY_DN12802_c0_g1~~TRINITY_DN12802_c0_g1_i2.p2  ORF type:complete len:125 (+),score=40.81 TRINITY_DN12802_c0_g1_i2:117-491(+)